MTATLAYISPEVARAVLARKKKTSAEKTYITSAIGVFALRLTVAEMISGGKSLWEFLGAPHIDEHNELN